MFKIINGSELIGKIEESTTEYFYGHEGRETEAEYLQLLKDSQAYFEGVARGEISLTDAYFIYAPESFLTHGIATQIAVIKDEMKSRLDARELFVNHPVTVEPCESGYTYQPGDGRHRYSVAQKYNLKLLVDVKEPAKYGSFEDASKKQKRASFF